MFQASKMIILWEGTTLKIWLRSLVQRIYIMDNLEVLSKEMDSLMINQILNMYQMKIRLLMLIRMKIIKSHSVCPIHYSLRKIMVIIKVLAKTPYLWSITVDNPHYVIVDNQVVFVIRIQRKIF